MYLISLLTCSDVLLRHRRRCHPTPPPRDRSSHSPLPPLRAHPSVPISSSRTSEREQSPIRSGRKHARESNGASNEENPSNRPRLSPEAEDDDDRFDSRFSRNGMGNGGVFGVTDNYYEGNPVSTDDAYAPHLLPMFQNASGQFHNMNDPNHLEDASVLLSMAYPGGVPGSENGNGEATSTSPSQAIADLTQVDPELVNATADKNGDKESSNGPSFSSGAVDNPARPAAPGAVLPESMENFAGTMDWLDSQDMSNAFMTDDRPLSPFNMSNLFSPSTFNVGLASPGELSNETTALAIAAAAAAVTMPQPDGQNNGFGMTKEQQQQQQQSEANQVVAAILEQLAKNDVPETKGNPNPERPLLRLASKEVVVRAGQETPRSSRFYLPADRFAGCYQVPHWALPPLRTLSVMAARTYYSVLNHFPFVHDPTFRLVDTAACLAFAICTVGGIRIGNNKKPGLLPMGISSAGSSPVSTGVIWERVGTEYSQGTDPEEAEDRRRWQEWDAGNVVRHEKTNMLVKSFSLAKGVLMTDYNVALLQALILYHAPYFLSHNDQERRHANMFLGTIVNVSVVYCAAADFRSLAKSASSSQTWNMLIRTSMSHLSHIPLPTLTALGSDGCSSRVAGELPSWCTTWTLYLLSSPPSPLSSHHQSSPLCHSLPPIRYGRQNPPKHGTLLHAIIAQLPWTRLCAAASACRRLAHSAICPYPSTSTTTLFQRGNTDRLLAQLSC